MANEMRCVYCLC